MTYDVEEYRELQNDIFDRYNCNDVENMSLQEFTEIVQYDYHNIAFYFSRELCRPKWEDCQDRRIEREEQEEQEKREEKGNFTKKIKKFVNKIMKKPSVRGKVNQSTKIEEILEKLPYEISAKDLAKLTKKPEPSVRRDLAQGVKKGLWERIGKKGSRGVKYKKL